MNANFKINGKEIETKRLILRPFKQQDLEDFYEYAKVEGVGERAGWKHHESIDKSQSILDSFIDEDKTFAIVLKENNKYSLIDLDIKTGRKNQIRVHLKENGNVIVGDKKYGSKINPINRMALHAYKLELIDPRTNKKISFKTNMPTSFNKLIK